MRWPWRKDCPPTDDAPDPDAVRERLEHVRSQRPHVNRLIVALRVERELNNFGTNAESVFLGREQK